MMRIYFLLSLLVLVVFCDKLIANASAENLGRSGINDNRDEYIIHVKKTGEALNIDGVLKEPVWDKVDVADDFWRVLPIDGVKAIAKTEVMLTYDEDNLYVGVICHESQPGKDIIESLRRDFTFGANDNFLLFLDTYNDQTNGYSFGISAGGAQWDGIQSEGGTVALTWDCKWESAVAHFDKYWSFEMAIPFRNMQFKQGVDHWGVNFSRLDLKQNEKSSWAPVPRQFPTASLAFTGTLKWEEPPSKPKTNFSLIPYLLGGTSKDIENDQPARHNWNAGTDAKISLSPTMNLDLTVNPDFSQVDVDEQVTNLDRFELFFPEKRRFFLENEDLFTGYGKDGMRPFFSRRIGINSRVLGGARLSGKLDENWRIGFLNMQTKSKEILPAANFTVASIQRKVFARSNVGVFFINKQLTSENNKIPEDANRYNRVFGIDYNLASSDNRWLGKFFVHKSITADNDKDGFALSGNLTYNTEHWELSGGYDRITDDYLAESGFVRRTGLHRFEPSIGYKFYPESEKIANHGPELSTEFIFDPSMHATDREISSAYSIEFLNRSFVRASYKRNFVKLLSPFDPTNSGRDSLQTGTEYQWNAVELEYLSDARKLFNYQLVVDYGGFFNGDKFTIMGTLNYRFQPYGSISANIAYNNLQFPEAPKNVDFLLLGPKLDITFTNDIFLTAFWQYNEQIDNINTNIRLQWRYKPVSDLFIVYTDNYFPNGWVAKNRAIVAKISYWFN